MATTNHEAGRHVALGEIRVPENVRALDAEHVKALAGSIKLQGMLVPVVVRDDSETGFELVAGFHRVAAARSLGLTDVPVVVRVEDTAPLVERAAHRRHEALVPGHRLRDVPGAVELDDGHILEAAVAALDHPVPGERVEVGVDPAGVVDLPDNGGRGANGA